MNVLSFSFKSAAFWLLILFLPTRVSAQYEPGFTWNRTTDFKRDQAGGIGNKRGNRSKGNPVPDATGTPVWKCVAFANWTADRWYEKKGQLMVWNYVYEGSGGWVPPARMKSWASAAIDEYDLHVDAGNTTPVIPLVRWLNPVAEPYKLRVSGTVTANFDDERTDQSVPIKTTFRLIHFDRSADTYHTICESEFSSAQGERSEAKQTLNNQELVVEQGDAISFVLTCQQFEKSRPGLMLWLDDRIEFKLVSFSPSE